MVEDLRAPEKVGSSEYNAAADPWMQFRIHHPKLYGCTAGAAIFGIGAEVITGNPILAVVAGAGGCAFGAWEELGYPPLPLVKIDDPNS
jgi:hypothetical protein